MSNDDLDGRLRERCQSTGEFRFFKGDLINPDGPEAADRIAKAERENVGLRNENARLRAGLFGAATRETVRTSDSGFPVSKAVATQTQGAD